MVFYERGKTSFHMQPFIPDHELSRVIGRGAYGEIWLGRSVTGTLRAIKVVHRQTFEDERAFVREFEGMARFEPISRNNEAFVDILHVGRDPGGAFFYYVMELADDLSAGDERTESGYEPKTLKSAMTRRQRMMADECVAMGLSLTQALGALHRHGLVHRDIKPANIIFVAGKPKIADIGLVAAHGQRSYVGTEGYVPPEGPGTIHADLYSVGKLLYELSMGKDRLDFPSLHSDFPTRPDREKLLLLNKVLLRACDNDPRKRYATAEEMHDDLERIAMGRAPKASSGHRTLLTAVSIVVLIVAGIALSMGKGKSVLPKGPTPGSATLTTDPPGAMVIVHDGVLKPSPATFENLPPGVQTARILMAGYAPQEIRFNVLSGSHVAVPPVVLSRTEGSLEITSTPPGVEYRLKQGETVLQTGTTPEKISKLFTGAYAVVFSHKGRESVVRVDIARDEQSVARVNFADSRLNVRSEPPGAEILINGVAEGVSPAEVLVMSGPSEVTARLSPWPEQKQRVDFVSGESSDLMFVFEPGSVKISSAPSGASVTDADGTVLGETPLTLEGLKPGPVEYTLQMGDYKPLKVSGVIRPGGQIFLPARFEQRRGPQRGKEWENSLGMKFVPVGDLLVAVWLVREKDYRTFCENKLYARVLPDFPQGETHPVVNVSWEDAVEFCNWLTAFETKKRILDEGQSYRLPNDLEWSAAAGLPFEPGETPEDRDGKLRDYLWGRQWPPPYGMANLADHSLRNGIPGYSDGFLQTAPVGSFAPNRFGIHDMIGNVWEWCLDSYKGGSRKDWGVLRGGSWATKTQAELRAGYRNVVDRSERDVIFGFRVVVEPGR